MQKKKRPQQSKKAAPKPGLLEKRLHEASVHIKEGRAANVSLWLLEATKNRPKDPRIADLLGSAYANMGRYEEAVLYASKAVALSPEHVQYRTRYALALQNFGDFDDAILEYQRALYRSPNNVYILRSLVGIYTDLGDHPKALEALGTLEQAIKDQELGSSITYGVALSKARLSPKTIPAQEVIDELSPLAYDEELPSGFRTNALHNLGRLYESIEDYDNAIKSWTEGNDSNKPDWDPDIHSEYISKLIQCWKDIDKIPAATNTDGSHLIFVTGMMRSGTSLTEQLLGQLPNITPGGELNISSGPVITYEPVKNPQGGRPVPISRLVYNQRVINDMSRTAYAQYLELAPPLPSGQAGVPNGYITDKQPYNVFYIPLITKMFPGAKIIHCCRDAQDCCLSNYMQTYARSHPQTHDLYWMGRYHADYQRMMAAWHSLPGIEILDIQYEDTVADLETQSKRICEFINQPWSEEILDFHNSDRTVRTASREQVRKPIYKSSVMKYTHYHKHLAPLRKGLGLEE